MRNVCRLLDSREKPETERRRADQARTTGKKMAKSKTNGPLFGAMTSERSPNCDLESKPTTVFIIFKTNIWVTQWVVTIKKCMEIARAYKKNGSRSEIICELDEGDKRARSLRNDVTKKIVVA